MATSSPGLSRRALRTSACQVPSPSARFSMISTRASPRRARSRAGMTRVSFTTITSPGCR